METVNLRIKDDFIWIVGRIAGRLLVTGTSRGQLVYQEFKKVFRGSRRIRATHGQGLAGCF
jgi:hypothetical protein